MEIALTELAAIKVKEIMLAEKIEIDMALRVKVSGGGCNGFQYDLFFDKPQDTDIKLESSNVNLIVDSMSIMYLEGITIDYVDGLSGAGFKFNNPQVKANCACGSSFSI